ncbi:TPA: hypothetical protein ACP32N_005060 [Pseudomonas aeruginosa]
MMKLKRPSFRSFKEPVTVPGWAWWTFAYIVPLLLIVPFALVVANNVDRAYAMIHIVNLAIEHGLLDKTGDRELLKVVFSGSHSLSFLCAGIAAVVVLQHAVVMLSKQRKA